MDPTSSSPNGERFFAAEVPGFLWELFRKFASRRNARAVPGLSRCKKKSGTIRIMTKEREYRAYAGTCVDLATKAPSDKEKKHLLAMAEAWLGLADRVRRSVPEPDASSVHPALRAKFGW